MTAVGVIGPGRAGLGLGLALARAGYRVAAHSRTPRTLPPGIEATSGGAPPWVRRVEVVLLAVPDDAIEAVAAELGATGQVESRHTVLHLSGVRNRSALAVLAKTGAALGSLHPLQTLADAATAPERLRGALAVSEGDDRAVEVGSRLAADVGLRPVPIRSEAKALYHAAGVFGSNYVVAVLAVARRLLEQSGMKRADAEPALLSLLRGTTENIGAVGLDRALTGPAARGDVETIQRHVAALRDADADLYRLLGQVAAQLAPLDSHRRAAVRDALTAPARHD